MKISTIATGIKYVFLKFNLSPYTDLDDRQFKSLTEMKSRSLPIFHRAHTQDFTQFSLFYIFAIFYIHWDTPRMESEIFLHAARGLNLGTILPRIHQLTGIDLEVFSLYTHASRIHAQTAMEKKEIIYSHKEVYFINQVSFSIFFIKSDPFLVS
jgi:hypothetical protein